MRIIVSRREPPQRTWQLHAAALKLLEEGELMLALEAAQDAMELLEQHQGPDSLDLARVLNTLSEIQIVLGRLRRAAAMANRSRMIVERLAVASNFPGDFDELARTHLKAIEMLARALHLQGRVSAAESVHRRTLDRP
jgi:hypothetical protein